MLFLITGKPGSFKTAKTASLAIAYLKEGRQVYTNIDEFDYDGVQKLPVNNDWRDTPDGSVVIYDEAQQFDFLQYKGREKLSTDGRVKDLEVHRHTGHDIILVTQSPSFIHNHVLSLVGSHYHLHRAYGRAFADVFLWRYAVTMPDSTGAKNKAESHEKFKPDSKIFDKYKSTTLDTHKLKIPTLYWKLGGFLVGVIALVGFMVFGSDNPFLSAHKIKDNIEASTGKNKDQKTVVESQASKVTTESDRANLDIECRKGINVEKPECVQWFNDLTNRKGSYSDNKPQNIQVAYNPDKPFEQQDIQQQITYEVTAKPVLSGCMSNTDGTYTAYTQQGTKLQVSQQDCRKIMSGDRPFNYFANNQVNNYAQHNQPNIQANNTISGQQNTSQYLSPMTADQYARYLQYLDDQRQSQQANNYIQPNLQPKIISGANAL